MEDAVLVTGAGGFIGGHLVAALLSRGHQVRAVDCKPADEWHQRHAHAENLILDLQLSEACQKAATGIDQIYNLAADMGGMGFIESNRAACMLSVLINTNLIVAARDQGASRYFYASSACIYPAGRQDQPDLPALREDDAYPAMPEDGYGWEKLFSERMCRHFREDFGLATRVARYHNVYGPYGTWKGGREKAPAALCRKVAEAKLSGTHTIEIWGDGEQTRSFTHIADCIEGTIRITQSAVEEPLNVGSSELVSINDVVSMLERIAGVRLRRSYKLDAPQGVRGRNSDNTRIRELLGWEPSKDLESGLAELYAFVYDAIASSRRAAS